MGLLTFITNFLSLGPVLLSLFGILKINVPDLLEATLDSLEEPVSCDADYKYTTTPEFIRGKGYCAEVHHVENQQGYVLELHRISCDRNGNKPWRNRPVVMHHGFLSTSMDFVNNYPDKSLGYRLADLGYDIWLLNVRGNYYSTNNTKIKTFNPAFWNFTFDTVIAEDCPVLIEYILAQTNKAEIYYFGYSMGTTLGFGACSSNLTLQKKVKGLFQIGPVATLSDVRGAFGLIPSGLPLWLVRNQDLLPRTFVNDILANLMCLGLPKLIVDFSQEVTTGDKFGTLNRTRYSTILKHFPAGSGIMMFNQFVQIRDAKRFQFYDYGEVENLNRYKQAKPPGYDISKITAPVLLYNAPNDYLSGPNESVDICKKLPNCTMKTVGPSGYGHIGLMYNSQETMISDIINQINKFDLL